MLEISKENYKELLSIASDTDCTGMDFPKIEDIRKMIYEPKTLLTVFLAFLNSEDTSYTDQINQILHEELSCLQDSNNSVKIPQNKNISAIIENINLNIIGFLPSKREIETYCMEPTEENFAFLSYLAKREPENNNEKELQEYIIEKLNSDVFRAFVD